jgi:DNA-binding SARP family transcriptional activator
MTATQPESSHRVPPRPVPRQPPLSRGLISRHRIRRRIGEAFESGGVVEVLAAAGWGKTTAARQYAAAQGRVVIWHTVGDHPAGELHQLFRGDAFADTGRECLLVLDDAHRVLDDPAALGELQTLLAGAPATLNGLLVTREHLGHALREAVGEHGYSVLTEADLRLTAQEAAELRSGRPGGAAMDVPEVLRQTGGWIAGAAMFAQFGPGSPRLYDVLFEYIETEVVGPLTQAEQDFLRSTSILPQVTVEDARVLAGDSAEPAWLRLRGRILPLTQSTDSDLSYRAPLRAYLQDRLARADPGALPRLRARYLEHLVATERFDDAIAWCIGMGAVPQAVTLMERSVGRRYEKTPPWSDIAAWMEALGERTLLASDVLAGTVIRVLHHDRRIDEATSLILKLRDDGRMDGILAADPSLLPVVMWSLHRRPDDAFGFIRNARGGEYRIDAIGYMLAATGGIKPAEPPIAATWGEMATIVHWGMIWQGRLNEVIDSATESPDAFEDNANLVLAALWAGRPELASNAWDHVPEPRRRRAHAVFAEAAMRLAGGDHDGGLRLLREGMPAARRTMAAADFEVLIAYLTLKQGAARKAIDLLEARIPEILQRDRLAIAEWAQFILALAYLDSGEPAEAARLAAECTRTMQKAGRHLLLTAARRVHAEAALRLHDPELARSVLAGLPPSEPGAPGSPYWEAEASRWCTASLDVKPADTPAAAAVGQARTRAAAPAHAAYLSTFGDPAVLAVDGKVNVLRRTKLAELVADLAVHGGATDRVALQLRMFPDADRRRAGNHFRQVLFKLRELAGITLDRPTAETVSWPAGITLTASDTEFEEQIRLLLGDPAQAGLSQPGPIAAGTAGGDPAQAGTDLDRLRAVLDIASGVYLPASELDWVAERRNYLSLLYEEGVTFLLKWAFDNAHLDLIREYGARATRLNPYTEHLYLIMMRAEITWGQPSRARAIYRRAYDALRELGLEPSAEMRRFAQSPTRLRRAGLSRASNARLNLPSAGRNAWPISPSAHVTPLITKHHGR